MRWFLFGLLAVPMFVLGVVCLHPDNEMPALAVPLLAAPIGVFVMLWRQRRRTPTLERRPLGPNLALGIGLALAVGLLVVGIIVMTNFGNIGRF